MITHKDLADSYYMGFKHGLQSRQSPAVYSCINCSNALISRKEKSIGYCDKCCNDHVLYDPKMI